VLGAFANAFRTPDLRRKLLFVLMIITIFRLGSQVPTPGVHVANVQSCLAAVEEQGIYNLINMFSGGALLQLTIFALGIMPYITASIILQLLVVVIPRLEALKKEGQAGQTKITQYTRYLTLGLAVLQATGIVALARSGQLLQGCNQPLLHSDATSTFLVMVVTMTAGTAVIMWLGELITDRGIGNGMSLLIFAQVVATFPSSLWQVKATQGWWIFAIVMAVGLVIIAGVIFIEQAQRRIPVQYAKRMVGRRMYGGQSTYIPLKVNQAGVIPIIFASSLLYIPVLLASIVNREWVRDLVERFFQTGSHPLYIITYFLLIIGFAYFYNSIAFNPVDTADNMKKYGGFIPGIRPGRQTAEHLNYILTRITLPGAVFLGAVAILPFIALAFWPDGVGWIAQRLNIQYNTLALMGVSCFLFLVVFELLSIVSVQDLSCPGYSFLHSASITLPSCEDPARSYPCWLPARAIRIGEEYRWVTPMA
jgi:preprotein translocase subunit SecY